MKYQVIIFDMDGTLLNTLDDLYNAVNYVLLKFGYPLRTREEVRSFVGNGVQRLVDFAIPNGQNNPHREEIFADFKQYYNIHGREKTQPYPGITELLQELKSRGYQLGVVSNKYDAAVKTLSEIYFPGVFATGVGEREGVRRKPAPDSVFAVLNELRADASGVLYVGDSEVDIRTAENAGVACISVAWGFRDRDLLEREGAKQIIDDPSELLQFVE
ncbi:MAG: HAD family hydrolase [Methanocorpusculum sp.]|jgi:phosphoglycolate phosphatase|nr:HAD family hydrolase [Methanocorpusculum sp.]MDD4132959.1 HAD family hydrolase [Methanocorpusculum sp.]